MDIDKITREYGGIVVYQARRYYKRYPHRYELSDLVQVGQMGLMKACKKYKENKGTKFSTFATSCIIWEIGRYVRDDKFFLAKDREERLLKNNIYSLNAPVDTEKSKATFSDIVTYNNAEFTEDLIENLDLKNAISKLKEKDRISILLFSKGYTQKEIAQILGTNQTQVSRDLKTALSKLKNELAA